MTLVEEEATIQNMIKNYDLENMKWEEEEDEYLYMSIVLFMIAT